MDLAIHQEQKEKTLATKTYRQKFLTPFIRLHPLKGCAPFKG